MRSFLLFLCLTLANLHVNSQYATTGTGALRNQIWWFDWNGFTINNGATRSFTTDDGLNVTISFSGVLNPVLAPSVMNTWSGSLLHVLYNFTDPAVKPALFRHFDQGGITDTRFTMNISVTRNGQPTPFTFIAADAEASTIDEVTTFTTTGSNWTTLEFFRNSTQINNPLTGCGTATVAMNTTQGTGPVNGQNPILATNAAMGQLSVGTTLINPVRGGMAVAFGLFSPVDRGDLPVSYGYAQHRLLYTNSNGCNYMPPFPVVSQDTRLKIGTMAGDADNVQSTNDNSNGVDEEGMSNFPSYNGSGSYQLTIPVSNTTGSPAYLTGLMDKDRNGSFSNTEAVTALVPANATSVSLSWSGLPPSFPSGTSNFAFRFRLCSNQQESQSPTGFAGDGEVEDYLIPLDVPLTPVVASFTAADTICVNNALTITNTSNGQTTNYWNFCAANINTAPAGTNMGNIGGLLTSPVYLDYVKDNNNYYGFVTDNHTGNLLRLEFGNSLLNNPSAFNLGNFAGLIPVGVEGLQIVRNENKWYVIIVAGDFSTGGPAKLIKIELGNNITNPTPAATNWGNIGSMSYPHDLYIFQDGGRWYGFTANTNNNTITRFDFTSSFSNTPTGTNLGNVGGLNLPTGLYTINDNGNWYTFVTNYGSSTLTRLDFGNSLLNTPTGQNLGNPGGIFQKCWDISLIKYCDGLYGYIINADQAHNNLLKLDFGNAITNTPTITDFGNTGNMLFPHSISRLFRTNDDLYAFVTNVDNNTITRLRFAGCTNASMPSSTATNPPPITYNAPGTYNINLTVDDGLPTQASFCKPVVVLPPPPHTATPTYTICAGNPPIRIGRDITGTTTYQWNTGATTDSIDISQPGIYWVDMTRFGCTTRDSFLLKEETANFSFTQDLCNPLQVTFYNGYTNPVSSSWNLGNGTSTQTNPTTTYAAYGDYTVSLAVETASGCRATITKPVTIGIKTDSVITNNDTTICHDATLQLRSVAGVAYCWYPATGLSATNIPNPVATPPTSPMTYYVHAQVVGQNIVTNGDFSQGNTGFTSAYVYSPNNTTEGQYMVSPFPRNWNPNVQACNDHTTGTGNMMMVNGSPVADVNVWKQTITVTPNTDYAFSTWIQAVHIQNPARLQFSINDQQLGALISADPVPCTWKQFYTIWNSGSATTATISIINKNTIIAGNDFALDDISFAPVTLQKDSIIISRERPVVLASGNDEICEKRSTTLSAAGAATYTWSPATSLDNANSPTPVASPTSTTTYTVTGTTLKGCTDDDAITITVHPAPGITITEDTAICKNSSVQLSASGGITYSWTPVATLDDASSPRPVATPGTTPVKYYVTATDARTCTNTDSVTVSIRPDPVFTISADKTICDRDTIRITAGGGDVYSWLPAATLSDPELAAPLAFPSALTIYSVHITDTICDNSADLSTTIRVNPLPNVVGSSTNDLDCSYGSSQLNATGARRYLWSPAAGLSNPAIANPVASPLTAIDYVVKGTDILGCSNTDTVKVALLTTNKGDNLVPNAFTPNGDGKNDCFGINYWGVIEKIDFSVYNRWGERVFYTNMPNGCWDGVYKGKKQDGNVFVYYIRAVTNCGIIERKGTVVLIQ